MIKLKSLSRVRKDGRSEGTCRKSFKPARVNCRAVIRDLKNQTIKKDGFSSTLLLGQCLFVQASRQKVSYCEQKQRERIRWIGQTVMGERTSKQPQNLQALLW